MAAAFSRREEEVLYWASYGVEVWAPVLAPIHTFPTVLIPMDRPTAEACVRYGEALLASSAFVSGADQADLPPWDEEEALVDLERAVAAAMRDMVAAGLAPDGGFMVKCSDRSPKDAVTEHGIMAPFLAAEIAAVRARLGSTVGPDDGAWRSNAVGMPTIHRAMVGALRVESAAEAMRLLLVSFRILEDLTMRLDHAGALQGASGDGDDGGGGGGGNGDTDRDSGGESSVVAYLALRAWRQFDVGLEFRCFVYGGRLVAASQYFYDCYFPWLEDSPRLGRDAIGAALQACWETMSALVPYEEAVVDLAICGPRSDWDGSGEPGLPPVAADDVVLIEINPFDKFTDAGLFRWGGKAVRGGDDGAGFELRLVDEETVVSARKARLWWVAMLRAAMEEP